jgi:hypothetical protein
MFYQLDKRKPGFKFEPSREADVDLYANDSSGHLYGSAPRPQMLMPRPSHCGY